jgi:hypothetical protein
MLRAHPANVHNNITLLKSHDNIVVSPSYLIIVFLSLIIHTLYKEHIYSK